MSFNSKVTKEIYDITSRIIEGSEPVFILDNSSNLVGTGVLVDVGGSVTRSSVPKKRKIISSVPDATILVKKKAFSSMKHVNDIQWMDKTEKMLLRATKALFAYKVNQIRTYESLTKFRDTYKTSKQIDLMMFADLIRNASFLDQNESKNIVQLGGLVRDAISNSLNEVAKRDHIETKYDKVKEDVIRIFKRSLMRAGENLTTWIVDPEDPDPYGIGPGTGVIEIGMYDSFTCNISNDTSPSSGSVSLSDPHSLSLISDDDIEVAIKEALYGAIGLLNNLSDGKSIDARSALAAGVELYGLGDFDSTLDISYIRDRLRTFYLGKTIFNSGDPIYIYIESNNRKHDYSSNLQSRLEDDYKIDEAILRAEYNLYTDKSISFDNYNKLNSATRNPRMTCVFVGYITQINRSYSSGTWKTDLTLIDNMGWLSWSRFMIEPALSDSQGILEDPLTPFDLKVNASGDILTDNGVDLLRENKNLLDSGLLSFDSGMFAGQAARPGNLFQREYVGLGSAAGAKVLQHPNGFIYRWKQGIITATFDPPSSSRDGYKHTESLKSLQENYGLTAAQDVLNNIDVANIISLLISGVPYNMESFMEQAYMSHSISVKDSNKSLSSIDPISSVLDVVARNNIRFGSFKPYRLITLSRNTLDQKNKYNILRSKANNNINILSKRLNKLLSIKNNLTLDKDIYNINTNTSNSVIINNLDNEIVQINNSIKAQAKLFENSDTLGSNDRIKTKFNLFGSDSIFSVAGSDEISENITRAMVGVGAQRKIEDVRLNQDRNFLMISDQYDQNTDITPFLLAFKGSNFNLFKGQMTTVFDKCRDAAGISNMEFFCNTQGHLEFRPPQWNRTPLSVLNKLMSLDTDKSKGVVPDFLFETFELRTSSLKKDIYNKNFRIAIIALLMGRFPDSSLIPNFNPKGRGGTTSGSNSLNFFGLSIGEISIAADDGPSSFDLSVRSTANDVTKKIRNNKSKLAGLVNIQGIADVDSPVMSNTTQVIGTFDAVFRANAGVNISDTRATSIAKPESLRDIRIKAKTITGKDPGYNLGNIDGSFSNNHFVNLVDFELKDKLIKKLTDDLEKAISSRDSMVVLYNRNIKKKKELNTIASVLSGENVDGKKIKTGNAFWDKASSAMELGKKILSGSPTEGAIFDHLIEDDSRNLLGYGSGMRFIIHDEDIIQANFYESPPDAVRVDVIGNEALAGDSISKSFQDRYYWAGATDFDLWRQYGYKSAKQVSLPYASSSELQCKPFAILELQMQRVRINRASIILVGNEFYQPGDVVYLKSQGLLYYVASVQHTFGVGSKYTVNLNLENGHPPGQYLPSPMDILGQGVLDRSQNDSLIVTKSPIGDDSYRVITPDGALLFPKLIAPSVSAGREQKILMYRDNQSRFTNMVINIGNSMSTKRKVLIRGFVKGKEDPELDRVRANLALVKKMLMDPKQVGNTLGESFLDKNYSSNSGKLTGSIGMKDGNVKKLNQMKLPNSITAKQLDPDSIVEQIVYLTGDTNYSEIQCSNTKLLSEGILPLGGPKQRSWLDIRNSKDAIYDVSSIIEVGLLDIR